MTHNMSTADRTVRAVIGAAAAIVALLAGAGSAVGIILLIVAALMIGTAAAGFCPVYAVLRISTVGGFHREKAKV